MMAMTTMQRIEALEDTVAGLDEHVNQLAAELKALRRSMPGEE